MALFDRPAFGAALLLGGATGTRQVDALLPHHSGGWVHAVVFAGGSAFGLDAAGGVVRHLESAGVGLDVKIARVPVVPTAVLFDLPFGLARSGRIERPDADLALRACEAARDSAPAEGSVGAGTGATVGKFHGFLSASKGGVGCASIRMDGNVVVGALVVVNAFGDVCEPDTGRILAGARDADGKFLDTMALLRSGVRREDVLLPQHTTLALVVTNGRLAKGDAFVAARMAGNGLARVIRPFQTPVDGDVIIVLSVGGEATDAKNIGAAADEVCAQAVVRSVRTADGFGVVPSPAFGLGR